MAMLTTRQWHEDKPQRRPFPMHNSGDDANTVIHPCRLETIYFNFFSVHFKCARWSHVWHTTWYASDTHFSYSRIPERKAHNRTFETTRKTYAPILMKNTSIAWQNHTLSFVGRTSCLVLPRARHFGICWRYCVLFQAQIEGKKYENKIKTSRKCTTANVNSAGRVERAINNGKWRIWFSTPCHTLCRIGMVKSTPWCGWWQFDTRHIHILCVSMDIHMFNSHACQLHRPTHKSRKHFFRRANNNNKRNKMIIFFLCFFYLSCSCRVLDQAKGKREIMWSIFENL